MGLARMMGAVVLESHDSSTFFAEAVGVLVGAVKADVLLRARQSPTLAISIDEKGRYLNIVLAYLDVTKGWEPQTVVLGYRELRGLESTDLMACVSDCFREHDLDLRKIVAYTADGASVMGTRRAMGEPGGRNVAALLRQRVEQPVIVTHCSAHRLQLAINDAYSSDPELKALERCINCMFKYFRGKEGDGSIATVELCFWSEVTGEEMLSSLGTAKARWLSLLKPLKQIHKSYVTILAQLSWQYDSEKNRETKKTIQWAWLIMSSWETRVTVAGLVDILEECWRAKLRLEKLQTPRKIHELARAEGWIARAIPQAQPIRSTHGAVSGSSAWRRS